MKLHKMMSSFQGFKSPMRAAKCPVDLKSLRMPLLVTPKLDGIRTLTQPPATRDAQCKAVSRSFKNIPNKAWAALLEKTLPPGLDGESILLDRSFSETTSKVMTQDEDTEGLVFAAFDIVIEDLDAGYRRRMQDLRSTELPSFCQKLLPERVNSVEELLEAEEKYIAQGYEGLMMRSVEGGYKCGQSTLKQGWLIKMKRFEDAEAVCVGFTELMRNGNEQEADAFGRSKRSSHKDNKTAGGTLGALACITPAGVTFEVGTGFTQAMRNKFWAERSSLKGRLVKYSFQPSGVKNKPRFPRFIGFRHKHDL